MPPADSSTTPIAWQAEPTRRRSNPVLWVIAVILAVIAVELAFRNPTETLIPTALGQLDPRVGGRGVYAFTGQLDRNTFGLFMLDIDTGTVWCYEFSGQGPKDRKMRLSASRLWIYDRYLEDFNQDDPTPNDVAALIEEQRQQSSSQPPGP